MRNISLLLLVYIIALAVTPVFAVGFGIYSVGGIAVSAGGIATDGYDGTPFDMRASIQSGHIYMGSYHENGLGWSGLTGFYTMDTRAGVPLGSNTIWDPIYLWAQDSSQIGDRLLTTTEPEAYPAPGWRLVLTLDYVPESLNWTGPWQYEFLLDNPDLQFFTLPVPTVSNPFDGVRMHLTAYAPIPEPGSLLALLLCIGGFGGMIKLRKR